uniref:RING-type domain-containing protein n=1 Tax=Kalanchoe fedtschenkoi TaxID=63787 RepID=A0A7N0U4I9_KALFE
MEDENSEELHGHTHSVPPSFSPYLSPPVTDTGYSRDPSTSSSSHSTDRHHIGITYADTAPTPAVDDPAVLRDDTWSCILVVVTFWFFVSMTLILGVYGSSNVKLGPNSSLLLQPSPIFVQNVKVEELDDPKPGLMLYAFYKTPTLDVLTTWDEAYNTSVQAYSHEEWIYYLNKGAQITVSYNVKTSSSVYLVIAQGNEGLNQWLEDPTYPNTTMSWNLINGEGLIQQDIYLPANYYVALGNMNSDAVEVQLNISIRALQYNTTSAYWSCSLSRRDCSLTLYFPKGNEALLTSAGPDQGTSSEEQQWVVRLSYGPRWVTYIAGVGGMTLVMLLAFHLLNKFQYVRGNRSAGQFGEIAASRAPLLTHKDDDLISWGSSCDCLSNDEDDTEDCPRTSAPGENVSADNESLTITRRLCAICFDAPRDCFFLPCGHCVACYDCATRQRYKT